MSKKSSTFATDLQTHKEMESLQIIHSEFLTDYRAQQPITIEKRVNRLASKPLTPQNFKFYLLSSSYNSSLIEGSSMTEDDLK